VKLKRKNDQITTIGIGIGLFNFITILLLL
jgi:hypothetical protein